MLGKVYGGMTRFPTDLQVVSNASTKVIEGSNPSFRTNSKSTISVLFFLNVGGEVFA